MKFNKGFTLIELMVVAAVLGILAAVTVSVFINNMGATEQRSYDAAHKYVADNNIQVKRMTCAGDSDRDGYGTCTLVTQDEKIFLQCPSSWGDVNLWGATSCKEVEMNFMQLKGIGR